MPIYLIRNIDTNDQRLVRAPNAPQAVRHVARSTLTRSTLTAEIASQEQLVALLTDTPPVAVEDVKQDDDRDAQPLFDGQGAAA